MQMQRQMLTKKEQQLQWHHDLHFSLLHLPVPSLGLCRLQEGGGYSLGQQLPLLVMACFHSLSQQGSRGQVAPAGDWPDKCWGSCH